MTGAFTGKDILDTFTAAGIPAVWEWTGGPCRAVLVMSEEGTDGKHVRITDDDFEGHVPGPFMVGLYRHEEDDRAPLHIVHATTASDLLQPATRLLHSH